MKTARDGDQVTGGLGQALGRKVMPPAEAKPSGQDAWDAFKAGGRSFGNETPLPSPAEPK